MKPELIGVALVALVVLTAIVAGVRVFFKRKPVPEELERRRRLHIHQRGKMGDGEILDVDPAAASIAYSYSVAGVVYTAAQDAVALQSMLPDDPMTMIGPVSIKFDPHNPANSIILCEEWSGLRQTSRTGGTATPQP